MFNNPLESFHDTVVRAKREREQFDRLLTISTPRERVLVVFVALLLIICVAWLFLGTVTRSVALDGVLIGPERTTGAETGLVRAVAWLDGDTGSSVSAGFPVIVQFDMADGITGSREGEIAAVSAVPLVERHGTPQPVAPVSLYRIEVSLSGSLDAGALASRNCRIVIETGRQSPIALLLTRRS